MINLDVVPFRPGDRVIITENILPKAARQYVSVSTEGVEATIASMELRFYLDYVEWAVTLPENIIKELEEWRKRVVPRKSKYTTESGFSIKAYQMKKIKDSDTPYFGHKFKYREIISGKLNLKNNIFEVTGSIEGAVINKKGSVFYMIELIPKFNSSEILNKFPGNIKLGRNPKFILKESYIYYPNTLKQRFNDD